MSENERSLEHASLLTNGEGKVGSDSDKEESVEPEENGKVSVFINKSIFTEGQGYGSQPTNI